MIDRANQLVVEVPVGRVFEHVLDQAKRVWAKIAEILAIHAEISGAAALYEELSKLSDAELERRGIPRADLHRYVFARLP